MIARLAPSDQPFFLSVAYLAPHSGQPREPDDPPNLATPAVAPAPPERLRRRAVPLHPGVQRGRRVRQAAAGERARRSCLPARIAAIQENYRQRLESLLAVDEGDRADARRRSSADGELDNTLVIFTSDNGFFHGEHRIGTGKLLPYEPALRVPLLMRGPGIPAGPAARPARDQRRPGPHHPGRRRRAPPGAPRTAARCCDLTADPKPALGPRAADRGRRPQRAHVRRACATTASATSSTPRASASCTTLPKDPDQLVSHHFDPNYAEVQAGLAQRLAALRTLRRPRVPGRAATARCWCARAAARAAGCGCA